MRFCEALTAASAHVDDPWDKIKAAFETAISLHSSFTAKIPWASSYLIYDIAVDLYNMGWGEYLMLSSNGPCRSPYLRMEFPGHGGDWIIEPEADSIKMWVNSELLESCFGGMLIFRIPAAQPERIAERIVAEVRDATAKLIARLTKTINSLESVGGF